MRRAVIDIGTNTVKLLVADVQDGKVLPVESKDKTTRLGKGVDSSHRLMGEAIERTVQAIADLNNEARRLGASKVLAFSTSAAREAKNSNEFIDKVRSECGLEVQVISGQREAELIFRGVSSDPKWASQPILVVDVGGGSAEFIQGAQGKVECLQSLPLGAVRLTERFGDDFVGLTDFLHETLQQSLLGYDLRNRLLIGTGGTGTTAAKIVCGVTDHARISHLDLRALVDRLRAMPLADRQKVQGLAPERADIIIAGAAVFLLALEVLKAKELTVSVRNLRYGAVLLD